MSASRTTQPCATIFLIFCHKLLLRFPARLELSLILARLIREQTANLYDQLRALVGSSTTDFLWNTFKHNILKIANSLIPERKPRAKRFWLSRETRTVCRKKRRLFHTFKAYPTPHNLKQLKAIGNLSKRLIKRITTFFFRIPHY